MWVRFINQTKEKICWNIEISDSCRQNEMITEKSNGKISPKNRAISIKRVYYGTLHEQLASVYLIDKSKQVEFFYKNWYMIEHISQKKLVDGYAEDWFHITQTSFQFDAIKMCVDYSNSWTDVYYMLYSY